MDDIQIDPSSEIPLRRQLVNQFIVQIASGRLKPGEALPSVRQLERMKKIHRHTISRAFGDLVAEGWLVRTRGSVMKVSSFEKTASSVHDLNGVVEQSIRLARQHGYTAEQLHQCLRARIEGKPPDQILIVSTDPGLVSILKSELQETISCRIRHCSFEDLYVQSRRLRGALIVWVSGGSVAFDSLVPAGIPCYSITICDPGDHLDRIRQLRQPSVIAVVSVSKLFLERAMGVISPLAGTLHSVTDYLLPLDGHLNLASTDLVICDSVARPSVQTRETHCYRVISPESVREIKAMLRPVLRFDS